MYVYILLLPLAMFYSESEFAQDLQANTIIIVTAWKMEGKIYAECQAVEDDTLKDNFYTYADTLTIETIEN